jgi:predicted signal transduction protein with EAL and GGDEF domain
VLLEDMRAGLDARAIAQRILDALSVPFMLEGTAMTMAASIGIAQTEIEGETLTSATDLLRNADVAMYAAKSHGKARYELFDPAMHERLVQRLEMRTALETALADGELFVQYQPIVELATRDAVAMEALVRWQRPGVGVIPPLEFIPLAEETGLIVEIGRFVLAQACRDAVELRRQTGVAIAVSVNLSAQHLQHPDVVGHVQDALWTTGLDAAQLILEITESAMMSDMRGTVARLSDLKELGVSLAVDDFGTGYSSLALLQRLPVDTLKIDRSFVAAMTDGPGARALVRTIAQLGTDLGLRTLAEGVETTEQIDELRLDHIDEAQGFLLARPLDPETIERTILALMLPGQLRRTV